MSRLRPQARRVAYDFDLRPTGGPEFYGRRAAEFEAAAALAPRAERRWLRGLARFYAALLRATGGPRE